MQVRDAREDDKDQWAGLWAGYNEFYERRGPTAVSDHVTDVTWERFFDAYEPMQCMVAEMEANGEQRLVGLVHTIYHRNTTMIGPICYLQDLFTAPDVRGKGVGRALIEAVYAMAKEAGSPRVYWQTHETNKTAQALYDNIAAKSGFIVYRKDV